MITKEGRKEGKMKGIGRKIKKKNRRKKGWNESRDILCIELLLLL